MYIHRLWNSQQQQLNDTWESVNLTVQPGEFRLVFVGVRGYHEYTALGLDGVLLTEGQCPNSCKHRIYLVVIN